MTQGTHFTYRPIGILRSPYARRIDAPHQSTVVEGTETGELATATLELLDWLDEKVLQDLSGFDRLWLLFAFHRSEGWKSTVRPPRGGPKRGVFATRSPHRPNSIGLSAVELVKIEGTTLHLRGVDLLDGTPVLDIKPYVPYADAFPDSKAGWIDETDAKLGRYFAPDLANPGDCRVARADLFAPLAFCPEHRLACPNMKHNSSHRLFCWVCVLVILFCSGPTVAQGFVWCLGEDGHFSFELVSGKGCGDSQLQQVPDRSNDAALGLQTADAHCGPCLDLDISSELSSGRYRGLQDVLDAPMPAQIFSTVSFSPVPLRDLVAGLNPQPPPRVSSTLFIHRTVVLLI